MIDLKIKRYGSLFDKNILGWQGGAREGNNPAGGCILLPVEVGEHGFGTSMYVVIGKKTRVF